MIQERMVKYMRATPHKFQVLCLFAAIPWHCVVSAQLPTYNSNENSTVQMVNLMYVSTCTLLTHAVRQQKLLLSLGWVHDDVGWRLVAARDIEERRRAASARARQRAQSDSCISPVMTMDRQA